MSVRALTILEISQKQAYIFASNKLKENITNSANIAWILSADYFSQKVADDSIFSEEKNLVYAGGGHTVLTFETKSQAVDFTKRITMQIHKEYPQIELFAKTLEYDETKTPGENLKELTRQLEKKKSIRRAAFHQGSFGVEKMDGEGNFCLNIEKVKIPQAEERIDQALSAEHAGYKRVYYFSELGGSKDKSNFIAVVHIDGNAMGKRVENLYRKNEDADWDTYRGKLKKFSESIDKDFKAAYKDMVDVVIKNMQANKLDKLDLKEKKFPVRRVITAGDDICFVAEGRIGIECAKEFIKALSKKQNAEDKEGYAACAGVAVIHQKYPFYRAYELAELLCSNAKRFAAELSADGSGKEVSAIDWHIEFGEMGDTLEEIRENYQIEGDGTEKGALILRPYIIEAPEIIMKSMPDRQYEAFRAFEKRLQSNEIAYAKGKMKRLRNVLKQGKKETELFLRFNKIEELILREEETMLFDAIELMDTFIPLE